MLRYIKHNLTGIDGVEIYPILSLLIFVLFFTAVILFVVKMNKKHVDQMSALPLENDEDEPLTNNIEQ